MVSVLMPLASANASVSRIFSSVLYLAASEYTYFKSRLWVKWVNRLPPRINRLTSSLPILPRGSPVAGRAQAGRLVWFCPGACIAKARPADESRVSFTNERRVIRVRIGFGFLILSRGPLVEKAPQPLTHPTDVSFAQAATTVSGRQPRREEKRGCRLSADSSVSQTGASPRRLGLLTPGMVWTRSKPGRRNGSSQPAQSRLESPDDANWHVCHRSCGLILAKWAAQVWLERLNGGMCWRMPTGCRPPSKGSLTKPRTAGRSPTRWRGATAPV